MANKTATANSSQARRKGNNRSRPALQHQNPTPLPNVHLSVKTKNKTKHSPASVRHKLRFHSLVISLAYFLTHIPQHRRKPLNVTRQTRRPPLKSSPAQRRKWNNDRGDGTASAPWMTRRETDGTGVQNADACGRRGGVIMARCCLRYGCLQNC